MSFFDRAINAASDAARAAAANHDREQRRRAVTDQLALQYQAIQWSLSRIGRLAIDAGTELPPAGRPVADAIRSWEQEVVGLRQQLATLEQQTAAHQAAYGPPPRWQ